jgi:hypothetical protein
LTEDFTRPPFTDDKFFFVKSPPDTPVFIVHTNMGRRTFLKGLWDQLKSRWSPPRANKELPNFK